MPNDALIQQLETLRETYTRQQKIASGLQTALKTLIDADNRVQKAIADAHDQGMEIDVSNIQSILERTQLKEQAVDPVIPPLRRELKLLAALTTALKDAAAALRVDPTDVVRLDKAIIALQSAPYQPILDLLPELNTELELGQRALSDEFGQKLRDVLAHQDIQLGGRGNKFEIGRFELDANFAKRLIILRYGRDIVIPRAPITVDAAVTAYQNAAKLIMGRTQDGKIWIAQFYDAYQTAQRKRRSETNRVNIVDCYIELVLLRQGRAFASEPSKRTFTEYTRAQFIYDFYEFAHRHRLAAEGGFVRAHVATKSQTDSPLKSMWIVEGDSPYDGRYVADIEFVKD